MKSLARWCTTLGLIGSTVVGSWLAQNLEAFALPQGQILKTLGPIPVFTIADGDGAPLVASGDNQAKVAGVFISKEDAEQFITRLKTENPQLADQVKVVPVSLGEIYQLDQANEQQENGLNFAYVPMQEQVESAQTLAGEAYEGGVPLFVARGGETNGYLTVPHNEKQVIPFFFEQEQLQQMVTRFKEQQPDQASTVKIEVVALESIIATLHSSDNELLKNIILVPSSESLTYLESLSPNSPPN